MEKELTLVDAMCTQLTAQVSLYAKEVERLLAENKELRQEVAVLDKQLQKFL
jgi:cell division protein FtsB